MLQIEDNKMTIHDLKIHLFLELVQCKDKDLTKSERKLKYILMDDEDIKVNIFDKLKESTETEFYPEMYQVDSSVIDSVGWENNNLYVLFRSGVKYVYHDVARVFYEDLKLSNSPGSYYSKNIKGKYPSEKIKD